MSISEIKLLALEVEDGETIRFICPHCLGGHNNERSLTITRNSDGVVYNCFRNNCDLRSGAFNAAGRQKQVDNLVYTKLSLQPRKKRLSKFEGRLEPLNAEWRDYLEGKIGWTDEHHKIGRAMYAPELHRIAYPIFGPMGRRRGWVLRSYTLGVEPKALNRRDEDEVPLTSWYQRRPGQAVIIVEDIPSAVRGALHVDTIAMNGGGLGPDAVLEIAAHKRNVVWAFDEDATLKALAHHRKYKLYFESSTVLPLPKDLKDMTEDELTLVLSEWLD